jgi:4-hydroxybenzoate polyprenyltransferase
MNSAPSFLVRFYRYQAERFPVVFILLTLFPAILSSGAVTTGRFAAVPTALALAASVLYLLHIRIIDEHRDFEHDSAHHPARPMQRGTITKGELEKSDMAAMGIILAIGAFSGPLALFLACVMLLYSYCAGREFFLGERLRCHYFLYNAVNLVQMLFMQIFVYAIFADSLPFTALIAAHFAFTSIGTLILEFVRKIKIPGEDGSGKDTYTHHLGFRSSLVIHTTLVALGALIFVYATSLTNLEVSSAAMVAGIFALLTLTAAWLHDAKRVRRTEQFLQLAFVAGYGAFNLVLAFAVFG